MPYQRSKVGTHASPLFPPQALHHVGPRAYAPTNMHSLKKNLGPVMWKLLIGGCWTTHLWYIRYQLELVTISAISYHIFWLRGNIISYFFSFYCWLNSELPFPTTERMVVVNRCKYCQSTANFNWLAGFLLSTVYQLLVTLYTLSKTNSLASEHRCGAKFAPNFGFVGRLMVLFSGEMIVPKVPKLRMFWRSVNMEIKSVDRISNHIISHHYSTNHWTKRLL